MLEQVRRHGFGGGTSALLDPESTGALTVFAFRPTIAPAVPDYHVWVCRH
ncbi:EcoRII N-terminal effector-binding domain-containing protein [Lichenihabitans psoromatis]|nr:EcoRII N-terminal effector-binding domain-containing protein [Lichenihabitans psoromatis]